MRSAVAKPLDLEALRGLMSQMLEAGQHAEVVEMVIGLLTQMLNRNLRLELDKARLLRRHLQQTSERLDGQQLSLLLSLLTPKEPADPAPPPEPALGGPDVTLPEPAPGPKGKKKGHGRKPLPEHLPKKEILHPVPEAERPCPLCGKERTCIGHETSQVLEFQPASFVVLEHKREKLACSDCDQGVQTAPAPDKVIDKGRPGPGLLAQVVVAKYADHLPLNRQYKIYQREGVDLPPSTLMDWVAAVHKSVQPLVDRIGELALSAHVLQGDDIGIKVLDRDAPGGAKRGHLWQYIGDRKWGVFRYTPDWRKEGPQSYLAERVGWLVVDAYRGYDGLFTRKGATAVEVACWAHGRRGFFELWQAGEVRVAPVLEMIQRLYKVEEQATEQGLDPEQRLALRQRESAPVVNQIGAWCALMINQEPPKSSLRSAIIYLVNQWTALRRFLEDGHLPIDNTLVERRLRPVALGRKNYLFCGSDQGGERAASAYTLLGTCALVGAEPRAYLTDVLTKLEMGRFPASRLDELLPPNWIQTAPPSARVLSSR